MISCSLKNLFGNKLSSKNSGGDFHWVLEGIFITPGVTPLLFQRTKDAVLSLILYLQTLFYKTTESVRPGKKNPIKHKAAVKRFSFSYKAAA